MCRPIARRCRSRDPVALPSRSESTVAARAGGRVNPEDHSVYWWRRRTSRVEPTPCCPPMYRIRLPSSISTSSATGFFRRLPVAPGHCVHLSRQHGEALENEKAPDEEVRSLFKSAPEPLVVVERATEVVVPVESRGQRQDRVAIATSQRRVHRGDDLRNRLRVRHAWTCRV
jgi:hypothetical protein